MYMLFRVFHGLMKTSSSTHLSSENYKLKVIASPSGGGGTVEVQMYCVINYSRIIVSICY